MEKITCRSIYGNWVEVPRHKFKFRIGVYAVILQDDMALLVTNPNSGKLAYPGGGVELGEKLEDALRRELREEAGIEIEILRFLSFREHFFYHDPRDEAFHAFQFYYLCRHCGEMPEEFAVLEDEPGRPRWLAVQDCAVQDFQSPEAYDLLFVG